MAYLSNKKIQALLDETYTLLYKNSTRSMTPEEIDDAIEINEWPKEYKELYFKDPIDYKELAAFAINNKIKRPGYFDDELYYLPFEFYVIKRSLAEQIYKDMKVKYKLTKQQTEMLSGTVGLGHAPVFDWDN